jgi:hypothetical protein
VTRTENTRNAQRISMGELLDNVYLEERQIDGEIILKEFIRL